MESAKENTATCRLCREEKKLCQSHVFPEFLYKFTYDKETHTFLELSNDSNSRAIPRQKGFWEYLLCRKCESHIQPWESHVARVLFGGTRIGIEDKGNHLLVRNVDYKHFKLFQMSMIWRAGVSTRNIFAEVRLGPHQDRLRRMILEEDPGDEMDYPCVLTYATDKLGDLKQAIIPPRKQRFEGLWGYFVFAAGLIWIFVVSSQRGPFPAKASVLSKKGILPILRGKRSTSVVLDTILDRFAAFAQEYCSKSKRDGKDHA